MPKILPADTESVRNKTFIHLFIPLFVGSVADDEAQLRFFVLCLSVQILSFHLLAFALYSPLFLFFPPCYPQAKIVLLHERVAMYISIKVIEVRKNPLVT